MPIATSKNKTWPYILKEDRKAYESQIASGGAPLPPTVFHLRTLTNGERAEIDDLLLDAFSFEGLTPEKIKELDSADDEESRAAVAMQMTDKKTLLRISRKAARIWCLYGIAGWDRLYDEDGAEVVATHTGRKLTSDSLDVVLPYADELATAIQERNVVAFDDLKKSAPAS
jgi:hypothetical protein